MRQFDKQKGIFRPKKTSDLKSDVSRCIDMYCEWETMWIIDQGVYKWQFAMSPRVGAEDAPNYTIFMGARMRYLL